LLKRQNEQLTGWWLAGWIANTVSNKLTGQYPDWISNKLRTWKTLQQQFLNKNCPTK
jgi:hypothetical protein